MILLLALLATATDAPVDLRRADLRRADLGGADTVLEDPWVRLRLAQRLAADPDTAEEARDALLKLHRIRDVAKPARATLLALALRQDARPGWLDTYKSLQATSPDARTRAHLELRIAEARTWVRVSQADARRSLLARLARDPDNRELQFYVARSHMVLGEPARAREIWKKRRNDREFELGLETAGLAIGDGMTMDGEVLMVGAPLAARVYTIAANGYYELAIWMVHRADPKARDAAARAALGDVLLGHGRASEAAAEYRRALARAGDDSGVRLCLVRALLEAGDEPGAASVAAGEIAAWDLIRANRSARGLPIPTDALAAATHRLPPADPRVSVALAKLLATDRAGDQSIEELRVLVQSEPLGDMARLYAWTKLALADHQTAAVIDIWQLALTRASGPKMRATLASEFAGVYSLVADEYKKNKQLDRAVGAYGVAIALAPERGEFFSGLGGVLWQAGRLPEAQQAYLSAWHLGNADLASLASAARIALQREEPGQALDILLATRADNAELATLRGEASARYGLARLRAVDPTLSSAASAAGLRLLADEHASHPEVLRALADALLGLGHVDEALALYRRAQTLAPNPLNELGEATALGMRREYAAARRILGRLRSGPLERDRLEAVEVTLLRAEADGLWLTEGRDEEAFALYARALEIQSRAPDADPAGLSWTLTALGGMYLAHREPGVALAFYREAERADPANAVAKRGHAQALGALGRYDDARTYLDGLHGGELDGLAEEELLRVELAELERRIGRGDGAARRSLRALGRSNPTSGDALAAVASLDLSEGNPQAALRTARAALTADPANARALAVAMDAGVATGDLSQALDIIERAAQDGGGPAATAAVERARLGEELLEIRHQAQAGQWASAREQMNLTTARAGDDAGEWSMIGGTWFALGLRRQAREAYDRALVLDPSSSAAARGRAAVDAADGRHDDARRVLADAYARTGDPLVGVELARADERAGGRVLALAREGGADGGRGASGGGVAVEDDGWLRVLKLPSGETPARSSERMAIERADIAAMKADLRRERMPDAQSFGGVYGASGTAGRGWLEADMFGVAAALPVGGPIELQANALIVSLSDALTRQEGGAIAVGARAGDRLGVAGVVGTTPVGFDVDPTIAWLGNVHFSPESAVELAVDTGRTPVTDSQLAWAGRVDAGGPQGRVTSKWGGGWVSVKTASRFDAGIRAQIGELDIVGLDPVGRRAFTAWLGQHVGPLQEGMRVGAVGSVQSHTRQIDGYGDAGAGVFTPLSYKSAFARADKRWTLSSESTVCGAVLGGIESVEGTDTTFVNVGAHPAFGARAGGSFHLTGDFDLGATLRFDLVGMDWSQQSGVAWLSWGGGHGVPSGAFGVNGPVPTQVTSCE